MEICGIVNQMQITVFGASGKVGRRVVELALKRGYTVVAVVHRRDPFQGTPNLIVRRGDIRNPRDVEVALKGSRAVVSCLGSWGTKTKDILTTGMRVIIPEMEELGIRRIVTLTGADALAPWERAEGAHALSHTALRLLAGKVLEDGELHMRLLSASKLYWTTLRSPVMTTFGRADYVLGMEHPAVRATVHRQAVAKALVDQIIQPQYVYKAPFISRG